MTRLLIPVVLMNDISIGEAAKGMMDLAERTDCGVVTTFRGIPIIAMRGNSLEEVEQQYEAGLKAEKALSAQALNEQARKP